MTPLKQLTSMKSVEWLEFTSRPVKLLLVSRQKKRKLRLKLAKERNLLMQKAQRKRELKKSLLLRN
jgi:hypothetical protein